MSTKIMSITSLILVLIFIGILASCQFNGKTADKGEYMVTNDNIYKDTPIWELALAVRDEKIKTIEKIVMENPQLINYQDPKYGTTLLLWAVGMEKYNSAEALLKLGADPNIASTVDGETPLFLATGYSWVDNNAKKDPRYVKLLLAYGADPNLNYVGSDPNDVGAIIEPGTSPLMNSIGTGIDKTKALVAAGADINYKTETGRTPAVRALLNHRFPEYAHYLIVEKQANVTESYFRRTGNVDSNEELFPVSLLKRWVFELESEAYEMKMEIVEEFIRQGVDYWNTEIPDDILKRIKKLYPDTWEEYIKKY